MRDDFFVGFDIQILVYGSVEIWCSVGCDSIIMQLPVYLVLDLELPTSLPSCTSLPRAGTRLRAAWRQDVSAFSSTYNLKIMVMRVQGLRQPCWGYASIISAVACRRTGPERQKRSPR